MEGEGFSSSKRPRLSGKNKACIIFYGKYDYAARYPKIDCNICIVDLNHDHSVDLNPDDGDGDDVNEGFVSVSPTFQIDCAVDISSGGVLDAFCVLDEMLYMFEGTIDRDNTKRSVFAFDLTRVQTLTRETTRLEKGGPPLEARKIGEMVSSKPFPVALPTPNGEKIVVFPTACDDNMGDEDETEISFGGFELFDPAKPNSPESLPPIEGVYCAGIGAYGFVENSDRLLVQETFRWRMYYLDLALPDKKWEKLGAFYADLDRIPPNVGGISFFETFEKGRFCIVNRHGFYDLKDWVDALAHGGDYVFVDQFWNPEEIYGQLWHRSNGREGELYEDSHVARCLQDRDKREVGRYHFCKMHLEMSKQMVESFRVLITVCFVDLKSHEENVEQNDPKLDNTVVIKNHKFLLRIGGGRLLVPRNYLFFTF